MLGTDNYYFDLQFEKVIRKTKFKIRKFVTFDFWSIFTYELLLQIIYTQP